MNGYLSAEVCSECGGNCCKYLPGCLSPEDVGRPLLKNLVTLLETKKYAVDYWEGNRPDYFIRAAAVNGRGVIDPSWGGRCVFYTPNGCSLSFEQRPENCRFVKPKENGEDCQFIIETKLTYENAKDYYRQIWKSKRSIILKAVEIVESEPSV